MFSVQCYSMLARCCFDVAKSAACHPAWPLSAVSFPLFPFPLLLQRHILLPYAGSAFAWPPFFLHSIISNCEQIFQHTHTRTCKGERARQTATWAWHSFSTRKGLFIYYEIFVIRCAAGAWKAASCEVERWKVDEAQAGPAQQPAERQTDRRKREEEGESRDASRQAANVELFK